MLKKIFVNILPKTFVQWLRCQKAMHALNKDIIYMKRKIKLFSSTFIQDKRASLASLLVVSHVLEKGITMPNRRMGFGFENVRFIISLCDMIIQKWGADYIEVQAALADLKQYLDIHREANYELPEDIKEDITRLTSKMNVKDDNCYTSTKEVYFAPTSNFQEFAKSRHSVRWFADTPVDDEKLLKAIKLAQTAPSACNRQATRVKIISSKEGKELCCKLQHGNRGFGDKADKWLLITTELGDWSHTDVPSAYIDAGIFTMNLLYALHYYGIAACTLNAYIELDKRDILQKGLGYPASELPVVFIIIGNPAEKFMVPKSRRLNVNDIIQRA